MFFTCFRRWSSSKQNINLLEQLNNMLIELRSTNSINEKKCIMKKYPDTFGFLQKLFTAGPLFITSSSIEKNTNPKVSPAYEYDTIEALLNDLSTRTITGHAAINAVKNFIRDRSQYEQLIKCIIDKDLKVRMSSKLILDAIGASEEYPKPAIALAEDIHDDKIRSYFDSSISHGERWFASRKLDGIRCISIKDSNGKIQLMSRQGKSLDPFFVISIDSDQDYVLDGELCYFKGLINLECTKEDFQKASSIVHRTELNGDRLTYVIFDCLTRKEFASKKSLETLRHRLERLEQLKFSGHNVLILPQTPVGRQEDVETIISMARKHGWEGVMIRKDVAYQGRRTRNLIKFKDFIDAEFIITGYDVSPMRNMQDGQEITEVLLKNIWIEHQGNKVCVGSGFTIDQRRELLKLGDGLIGSRATICYANETKSKKTHKSSLRFPVFKSLYHPA